MNVADNLCNNKAETIYKVKQITEKDIKLNQIDITNESAVEEVFTEYTIDGVIHFAELKEVEESVEKPLSYYYNNLVSTMALSKACVKNDVRRFVFNSLATVY